MKASLVVFSLVAIIAVLLHGVVSLPPDFFRNGRGLQHLPPMHKKAASSSSSSSDVDMYLVNVACEFCAKFSPLYEYECKKGLGERRKLCVLGFLGEVQHMAATNGWQGEDEQ